MSIGKVILVILATVVIFSTGLITGVVLVKQVGPKPPERVLDWRATFALMAATNSSTSRWVTTCLSTLTLLGFRTRGARRPVTDR